MDVASGLSGSQGLEGLRQQFVDVAVGLAVGDGSKGGVEPGVGLGVNHLSGLDQTAEAVP